MARPEGERYKLVASEVVAMSSEGARHGRTNVAVHDRLREAVGAGGLPCEAFIDEMAVRIDDTTIYEPDVLLRCGAPVEGDCTLITDPTIVVEALSPSSRREGTGGKLEDYFRLPLVRHYLNVKTASRTVIHHHSLVDDRVQTRIVREGSIDLDPPRLSVEVGKLFP